VLAAIGFAFALATYAVRLARVRLRRVVVTTPLSRTNGAHLER
jgi:hypothetical protein